MQQADVVTFLQQLNHSQVLELLVLAQLADLDALGLELVARLEAFDVPLSSLRLAHTAVREWAGSDDTKLLYIDEIDDITRRIAAEIAVART